MEPERLERIFGRNLLADPDQANGFADLVMDKPFECVGQRAESAAALEMLRDRPAWRDTAGFLEPDDEHFIPDRLANALR
jgi:hypothetical protein